MKVIYNNFIPFKGYLAINLFGVVFVRKPHTLLPIAENHEAIHTYLMKRDGYVKFYLKYLKDYLFNLFKYRNLRKAYRMIPYEIEAYEHEDDFDYIKVMEEKNGGTDL